MLDLLQRQHARQHRAPDAEFLKGEIHRDETGRRALHREMQTQFRVTTAGIGEQTDVGHDHRVDAEFGGRVDRALPFGDAADLRKGVDGEQHFFAARLRVAQAFDQCFAIEIQAGEIARVGAVLEAEINRIGTVIDRRFQRRQTACRTNQFRQTMHGGHCHSLEIWKAVG